MDFKKVLNIGLLIFLLIGIIFGVIYLTGVFVSESRIITTSKEVPYDRKYVFDVLTNLGLAQEWSTVANDIEIIGKNEQGFVIWQEKKGDRIATFEYVNFAPPALIHIRIIDPTTIPIRGEWYISLDQTETGTKVRIKEESNVTSALMRFTLEYILGRDWATRTLLDDLERAL